MENPESKRFKVRLRPRRVRHESRAPSASRLRRISARLARRRGGRRRRPPARAGFFRFSPSVLQQSIVNMRYAPNRGGSHWRAHGRYLAREGAQEAGHGAFVEDRHLAGIGVLLIEPVARVGPHSERTLAKGHEQYRRRGQIAAAGAPNQVACAAWVDSGLVYQAPRAPRCPHVRARGLLSRAAPRAV